MSDMMTPDAAELARSAGGTGRAPLAAGSLSLDIHRPGPAGRQHADLGRRVSGMVRTRHPREDIALANMALDLIGQTQLWLGLASEVGAAAATPLRWPFAATGFPQSAVVERPNGDFGMTLMRQFPVRRTAPADVRRWRDRPTPASPRSRRQRQSKEVACSYRGGPPILVIPLGGRTEESHAGMQAALDALWGYTGEMFWATPPTRLAGRAGVMPHPKACVQAGFRVVGAVLTEATLTRPASDFL
ncbi:MAG: phenylacetate-CoA oxygenase subunit PaaI [Rhodobacter sp.]|nr:phenylacetate-CoA oxygenase subunit PaaI [Rhodobacter sp.]